MAATAPTTMKRRLKVKKAATNDVNFPVDEMDELLVRFEAVEEQQRQIEEEHEEVFQAMNELEDEKETIRQAMKRLAYTKDGPPQGVEGKTYVPSTGLALKVEITYKKRADYYEPASLPSTLLMKPGVIVAVDTIAVNAVLEDLENSGAGGRFPVSKKKQKRIKEIKNAKMRGGWMTPAVSIKRKG